MQIPIQNENKTLQRNLIKNQLQKRTKGNDDTQLQECIRAHDKDIPMFI
jgi:hypothetical protein